MNFEYIIGNILLIACIPLLIVVYMMMYEILIDIKSRRKARQNEK